MYPEQFHRPYLALLTFTERVKIVLTILLQHLKFNFREGFQKLKEH